MIERLHIATVRAQVFKVSQRGDEQVPQTVHQALLDPRWKKSMQKENSALVERGTWERNKRDYSKPVLRSLCVFQLQMDAFKLSMEKPGQP